jgi:hypothetical protein
MSDAHDDPVVELPPTENTDVNQGADGTSTPTDESAQKQRGRPFEPGVSGNPNGRPRGSRNKTTVALEALLDGEAEAITRKAIEKAKEGDRAALRLCVERFLPARRDRSVEFELPTIKTAADALAASAAVLAACADGALSPSEATEVMALVTSHTRTLELAEIEATLRAFEKEKQR